MRVRFVIRKARLNSLGLCPIDCRVRVNGVQATPFSTKVMVAPVKWDSKAQRIKGASEKVHTDNRSLEAIKYELEQLFLMNRARNVNLSAKEIVDIFSGKKEIGCSYLQLCAKKVEQLQSLKRASATIQIHQKCHKYLFDFIGENLQADEIEKRHIVGFWSHLKNKKYDHDYVNKTVANCKSLFIFAEKEGYILTNPFAGVRFTWEDKEDLTCLNAEEKRKLVETEWSPRLQKVVDSFLFMCYQGLHIADYRKLSSEDIQEHNGVKWIYSVRQKNKSVATIPLHSEAKKILDKYEGVGGLPKISGQKSNDYLSIVAEKIETSKKLTNKVARKTFTDMCINEYRMSDESVAAMLGHSSTKYVKKYGSVKQSRIIAEWGNRIE